MNNTDTKIILASKSPRRADLLENAGIEFTVIKSGYKEIEKLDLSPDDLAGYLALKKAEDVAHKHPAAFVIGADTIVVLEDEVLGKPRDEADAREMLKRLSGQRHQVITAFALLCEKRNIREVKSVTTTVRFKNLSEKEIYDYVRSGESMDKAGAYAIQGGAGAFVESIEGDYSNVVGLPVEALKEILKKHGALTRINDKNKRILRAIISGLVGAGIGYVVGYGLRCAGSTCPLTCTPAGSILLGAALGSMIYLDIFNSKKK